MSIPCDLGLFGPRFTPTHALDTPLAPCARDQQRRVTARRAASAVSPSPLPGHWLLPLPLGRLFFRCLLCVRLCAVSRVCSCRRRSAANSSGLWKPHKTPLTSRPTFPTTSGVRLVRAGATLLQVPMDNPPPLASLWSIVRVMDDGGPHGRAAAAAVQRLHGGDDGGLAAVLLLLFKGVRRPAHSAVRIGRGRGGKGRDVHVYTCVCTTREKRERERKPRAGWA